MWTIDQELAQEAKDVLDAEAPALRDAAAPNPEAACSWLEALGTLAGLAGADDARQHVSQDLVAPLERALAELEFPELDDASVTALELAPSCVTLDESLLDEELWPLLEALRTRDRVELIWLGAECAGIAGAFSDEALAARASYDETLAPALWQLVPLGARRSTELAWMSPTIRDRFWWRARGADLPADALDRLADRQRVLAVFPEARPHFQALDAYRPRLVSLGGWIDTANDAQRTDERGMLKAAAAAGGAGEISLLVHPSVQVGVRGVRLIVDVLDDLAVGAVPELRSAEGHKPLSAVEGTNQRFQLVLDDADRARTDARLFLPLRSGSLEVPLHDDCAD